jgi:hypothetical protein
VWGPVIIANAGHRKELPRKLGCGKIAAFFLHIPTSCGDRPASPPDFSASRFSRNFSDLEAPIYQAPLYDSNVNVIVFQWQAREAAIGKSKVGIASVKSGSLRYVAHTANATTSCVALCCGDWINNDSESRKDKLAFDFLFAR